MPRSAAPSAWPSSSGSSLPAAAAKTRSPSSIVGSRRRMSGVIAVQMSPRRPASRPISLVASPSKKRPTGPRPRDVARRVEAALGPQRRDVPAVAADVDDCAERDLLELAGVRRDARRRALVGVGVVARAHALAGRQAHVAGVVERRRRRDADEQQRHPDVHEVAAVAAPVARHERAQRRERVLAGHRAAHADAAPELLADAERRRRRRRRTSRARAGALAAPNAASSDADRERRDRRQQEVAPRVGGGRLAPGDDRPDPAQQDEHDRQRHRVLVEPRRPERAARAGHRLGDQRPERAPEDDEAPSRRGRGC